MEKRILIIAGETSGDLHAASLVREMKRSFGKEHLGDTLHFFGIGGDRMNGEGVELSFHVRDVAFMGFWEVVRHLGFLRRVFNTVVREVTRKVPDLAILVDYPGYNLRLAARLKKMGIPVFYYISPQIWAWRKDRLYRIARVVDRIAVFFPFERDIYERRGIPVKYVGHPLVDMVKTNEDRETFRRRIDAGSGTQLIGLLPGSRYQEVLRILPVMVQSYDQLSQQLKNLRAVIGMSAELDREFYRAILGDREIPLFAGSTYEIMGHSDLLWVTSGTATLEAAILGTPMVVLYKTSLATYLLARALISIKSIALVNIVAGGMVAPELIQDKAEPVRIVSLSHRLLENPEHLKNMHNKLSLLRERLGPSGATKRAALWAIEMI